MSEGASHPSDAQLELTACFCGGVHVRGPKIFGVGIVSCPEFSRYFDPMVHAGVFIAPELLERIQFRIPRPEQVW